MFMLSARFPELDPALRGHMTAEEPEVELEGGAIDNIDAAGQYEDNGALKALQVEREARKKAEREAKALRKQLDPSALEEAERRIKEAEAAAEAAESKVQQELAKARSKMEAELLKAAKERDDARTELRDYRRRIEGERIFKAAEGLDGVSGDGRSFFDYFWNAHGAAFQFDEDGSLIVVDADGQPKIDPETRQRIAPVDYAKQFHSDPVHGHLFKPAFGTGSGGKSQIGSRPMPGTNYRDMPKDQLFAVAFSGKGK